jgi:cellulose synthase/poly-beta-1,6-N-acetylglucosamine synthase-like glycosyltransferase
MLASLVVFSTIALVLSTLGLFSPLARKGASWRATTVVALLFATACATTAVAIGVPPIWALAGALILVCVSVPWSLVNYRWAPAGSLVWGSTITCGTAYLAYMLVWTLTARAGAAGLLIGLLLWTLQVLAFGLSLSWTWEMVDVLATRTWVRRLADGDDRRHPEPSLPFVSLHVPAHNEPPEMVIRTLRALLDLDYPAYEIVMIDDNTTDPDLWRPVADFCDAHRDRITFRHLDDWPGFKSGALNFAMTVTDPRAEVIGVVDADYLVHPDYLRRCASLFRSNRRLGFVQTPQDYRDWEQSSYYRRLFYSYSYFFAVSQVSRNENNGAIFGGTMGLIRRSALEAVGGWDEWCITEDAELSLRLLRAGWTGRHVDRSYGRGVMPLTFDALKRQRYRWCFGGIQILRMHWRSLLPWTRDEENYLTLAQRWSYLSGGLQWYADLLGLLFAAMLLGSVVDVSLGDGALFRSLSGFLLLTAPMLAFLNLARAVTLLRRSTGATWKDAVGAFGLWLALGWTVARASVRGLIEPAGQFLRTPKTRGDASWLDALRTNRGEVVLGGLGSAGLVLDLVAAPVPTRWLLALLLLPPTVGMLAAPANAIAAARADLPLYLRGRRRGERGRGYVSGALRPVRRVGVGLLVAVAAAAAGMLIMPPAALPSLPNPLHEADSGRSPSAGRGAYTPTPTPTPTPTSGSASVTTPAVPIRLVRPPAGATAPSTGGTAVPTPTSVPSPSTPGASQRKSTPPGQARTTHATPPVSKKGKPTPTPSA